MYVPSITEGWAVVESCCNDFFFVGELSLPLAAEQNQFFIQYLI